MRYNSSRPPIGAVSLQPATGALQLMGVLACLHAMLSAADVERPPNVQAEEAIVMATRILVVDDDKDIREVLRALFEDEGFAVAEARHGEEALKFLRGAQDPYVTLLDLRMPVLDGAGLLEQVAHDRKLRRRHAYILMTADARTVPLSFANLLTNMDVPVVSKPFDEKRLFSLVREAADRIVAGA